MTNAIEQNSAKPKRALVVIAMQNEYFAGGRLALPVHVADRVVANVTRTMQKAKSEGIPIIIVQHQCEPRSPTLAVDSHGWELHDAIKTTPFDYHLTKTLPSVFTNMEFGDILRKHDIDTITLVGLLAQSGILATAVEARCVGIEAEFLTDASASLAQINSAAQATGSEIHRAISAVMQASFAAVATVERWFETLNVGGQLGRAGIYGSFDLTTGMD